MRVANALLPLSMGCALLLSGCMDDDNDSRSNLAPTAAAGSFTTQADTVIEDKLSGKDPDSNTVFFSVDTAPAAGSVIVNDDGSFTYLPNPTYTGADQFTFIAFDGLLSSEPATVDITVEPLQVLFSKYSRDAYGQAATDEPLALNGREFTQDVFEQSAYDDFLAN